MLIGCHADPPPVPPDHPSGLEGAWHDKGNAERNLVIFEDGRYALEEEGCDTHSSACGRWQHAGDGSTIAITGEWLGAKASKIVVARRGGELDVTVDSPDGPLREMWVPGAMCVRCDPKPVVYACQKSITACR